MMEAAEHETACERGLAQVKRQPRGKLCRAQTYAFGQGQNALAIPKLGGAATAAPTLPPQQNTNFRLNFGGLPAFTGSPNGLGCRADVPRVSPSLDAMDIDFSSPAQNASITMLRRGLAMRLDTY